MSNNQSETNNSQSEPQDRQIFNLSDGKFKQEKFNLNMNDDEKERLLTNEELNTAESLNLLQKSQKSTNSENNENIDIRKSSVRWCMLFMACMFMFGNTFCYDNPGPLEKQLEKEFNMDSFHYSLLYTVYSIPNMILPILGGILLDSIGIRTGLILFCSILTLGQFVFMTGGFQHNYNELIAGRIIFGMGGESMGVAQSAIISVWFKGKELAFALGLNLSVSRLGSVINAAVVPSVYQSKGLGYALLVGSIICMFSLLSGIGIAYLDKKAEKHSQKKIMIKDDEKFKWSDLYSLKLSFWILTGSCVLTYMSIFPYIQVASDLLQTKYHFSTIQAGYLFGVPYIISAIASPFLGLLIDKFGKRALLSCLSSFILIIGFSSSMMMPECDKCYNEIYPLVLTGVGYSIYASAIWGSVPYVVKANSVGTAFGIATAIQNIGLCIAPLIVGMIKDKTKKFDHGYFWVNAFFVFLNCTAFCLNLTQYYMDIYYYDGVLDKVDQGSQKQQEQQAGLLLDENLTQQETQIEQQS